MSNNRENNQIFEKNEENVEEEKKEMTESEMHLMKRDIFWSNYDKEIKEQPSLTPESLRIVRFHCKNYDEEERLRKEKSIEEEDNESEGDEEDDEPQFVVEHDDDTNTCQYHWVEPEFIGHLFRKEVFDIPIPLVGGFVKFEFARN